jgi:hypothetical protein
MNSWIRWTGLSAISPYATAVLKSWRKKLA